MELDEYCKEVINGKLQEIKERMGIKPKVSVTYFVPDIQKEGGAYVTVWTDAVSGRRNKDFDR